MLEVDGSFVASEYEQDKYSRSSVTLEIDEMSSDVDDSISFGNEVNDDDDYNMPLDTSSKNLYDNGMLSQSLFK